MRRRIFISAGEASGDLHGAGLLKELRALHPEISPWGLGGERLRSQGTEVLYGISELSTMGFAEVLRKLPFFRTVIKAVARRFDQYPPDAGILIDYPGMNFRFAEHLCKRGIPFVYYVLPQVWAWHRSRVKTMKKWNAKLISILPFEPGFFAEYGLDVEYYGHPLVDLAKPDTEPSAFRRSIGLAERDRLVAVLPGSRLQEINTILPVVLSSLKAVQRRFGDINILCRPADLSAHDVFSRVIAQSGVGARIFDGSLYNLLSAADLTLVTSGTATLETAMCGSPAVVLYRTNWLTYLVARKLVKIKNISMANIIADDPIYPELIQSEVNPDRVAAEIERILGNPEPGMLMKSRAASLLAKLSKGDAYRKAARAASAYLLDRLELHNNPARP